MATKSTHCPACGLPVSPGAEHGLCPQCRQREGGSRAAVESAPPQFVGDNVIIGEIGRGGMGVVYRARNLSSKRSVAVKLLLKQGLASPRELERFQLEVEAASRLADPHIVPLYEVGQNERDNPRKAHEADHFVERAQKFAPDNPEVRRVRALVPRPAANR